MEIVAIGLLGTDSSKEFFSSCLLMPFFIGLLLFFLETKQSWVWPWFLLEDEQGFREDSHPGRGDPGCVFTVGDGDPNEREVILREEEP